MTVASVTSGDCSRRFERRFQHWDRNLDHTALLEGIVRLKAQSARTDILQAMLMAESEMTDVTLDRNVLER